MHDHSLDHEDQEVGEDVVSELVHQDKGLRVVDDQSQQDGGENADDVELHDSRAAEDGQEDTGVQNGILLLKRRHGLAARFPADGPSCRRAARSPSEIARDSLLCCISTVTRLRRPTAVPSMYPTNVVVFRSRITASMR